METFLWVLLAVILLFPIIALSWIVGMMYYSKWLGRREGKKMVDEINKQIEDWKKQ